MIRKEFTNKCSDDPFLLSCEEQGVESKHA